LPAVLGPAFRFPSGALRSARAGHIVRKGVTGRGFFL
jgi:hypothetical protein